MERADWLVGFVEEATELGGGGMVGCDGLRGRYGPWRAAVGTWLGIGVDGRHDGRVFLNEVLHS